MTDGIKRELVSIDFQVGRHAVNILWHDYLVQGDQKRFLNNHRGSYPTDEGGDLTPEQQAELGVSIATVLGDGLKNAFDQISVLEQENIQLSTDVTHLLEDRNKLLEIIKQSASERSLRDQIIENLTKELAAIKGQAPE